MFGEILFKFKTPPKNKSAKMKQYEEEGMNTVFLCSKCGNISSMYDGMIVDNRWYCEDCVQPKENEN